ncbi:MULTISPECIES: DUF389 domain-containing protein [Planktothricoides]|uniref:DUF389 domain-containing protein n=2 Tax=Planktothricoides raciborskii TaxID=132608 RepID=A0AAU8JFH9_9CYAN|nr:MULTISPECIES: DUF389 domain-containing protein [Planktothricoides]MBD2544237.1 DUF389 domain-containing protein [Planktothricoides raciborskii FACHB-1370]MBD2583589.1 DUF389 domain-containing protein [Planktothricoides raciborskii FACHB-1261]
MQVIVNQITILIRRFKISFKRFLKNKPDPIKLEAIRSELIEESALDSTYIILIISSCIIATLGLLANSTAVIIGAMIVAPLMLPIRSLAFGALEGDLVLFRRGLIAVTVGTCLAVALAWFLGSVVGLSTFGSEILARSKPNLLDLGIAIAAGSISGYGKVQPKISSSLAGTAIAVALMPPVCVIGLGLANGNLVLSFGALLLYLTNLLGITLSCMMAFFISGYTPFNQAHRALTLATIFTSILLIPLSISFIDLVRQNRLESNLKQALVNRTITFQRVDLVNAETNWFVDPPEVRLTVRSRDKITPYQVELIEDFLFEAMGQRFTLVFDISQVSEVRREGMKPAIQNQDK